MGGFAGADTDSPEEPGKTSGQGAGPSLHLRTVRGGVISLVNQGTKLTANLLTTVVLALYLGPQEFGLFAIAFSIQVLVTIVRDGGLANSLIQRRDVADIHMNSVLWTSLGAGVVLASILSLLARPIARQYGHSELAPMLWLMSVAVVAQGLASVPEARYRKRLEFGRLLIADSGSTLLACLVAVVAAMWGAGVWSLALRMVVAPIALAAACWWMSRWRPRLEFQWAALRSLWSFGGYLFLATLLGYGLTRLDSLIIGGLLTVTAAGTFFMARSLALTTIQELVAAVGRVMFPSFSAVQHDLAALRTGYLGGTRYLSMLVFPLVAALVAVSPEAVAVILDPEWADTVPIIRLAALHGVLVCLNNPSAQVLSARGRSKLQFGYAMVIGTLVTGSFVVGCRWGLMGVAVTWTVVRVATAPVALYLTCREIDLRLLRILSNVAGPALTAAAAGLAARTVAWTWLALGRPVDAALLAVEIAVGGSTYVVLSLWLLGDTVGRLRKDLTAALGWTNTG